MALLSAPRAAVGALAHGLPTASLKAATSLLVVCPAGRRAEAVAAALKVATGGALQAAKGGRRGLTPRASFVVRAAKGAGYDGRIVPAGDDDKGADGVIFVVPAGNDDEKDADAVAFTVDEEKDRVLVTVFYEGKERVVVTVGDEDKERVAFTVGDEDKDRVAFTVGGEDDKDRVVVTGVEEDKDRVVVNGGEDDKDRVVVTGGDEDKDRVVVTGGEEDKDRVVVTGGEEDKDRVVVTGGEEEKAGELYRVGNREVFIPEMTLYELVMICEEETGRLLNRARPPLDKLHGLDILKESHRLIKEEMRKLEIQDVPVPGGGRRVAHRMVGLHLRVIAWAGKVEGVEPHHYLPGFLTTGDRYRLPSKNKRAGTLMELLLYSMMMASRTIDPFLPEQVFDFTNYP